MEQRIISKAQAAKDFENALSSLAYTQNNWTVFEDFLDYCLLKLHWQSYPENGWEALKERYPTQEQQKLFEKAFESLSIIADNDGVGFHDPFGNYFMEHFGNKFKGQFFTPECVTDFMAAITITEDLKPGSTVCDPACGSGRGLLSAAKLNRKMIFYGADIDLNCCKMTVINMMMNTMVGEVAWMNTITMEHWKSWHINKIYTGHGYLPYYQITGPQETKFVERLKNTITPDKDADDIKIGKRNQIMLF